MAAPCKHWIVHRQICCRCRSPVKTYDTGKKRVANLTSLFPNCRHRMYQFRLCCRCGSFLDIWDYARAFNYIANFCRLHAKKVVKLLDPHMIYFGIRIITRRDSNGGLKSLELVLPELRGVLIVDYDHRLWVKQDHRNVIVMSKYVYFKESSNEIPRGLIALTLPRYPRATYNKHRIFVL